MGWYYDLIDQNQPQRNVEASVAIERGKSKPTPRKRTCRPGRSKVVHTFVIHAAVHGCGHVIVASHLALWLFASRSRSLRLSRCRLGLPQSLPRSSIMGALQLAAIRPKAKKRANRGGSPPGSRPGVPCLPARWARWLAGLAWSGAGIYGASFAHGEL